MFSLYIVPSQSLSGYAATSSDSSIFAFITDDSVIKIGNHQSFVKGVHYE